MWVIFGGALFIFFAGIFIGFRIKTKSFSLQNKIASLLEEGVLVINDSHHIMWCNAAFCKIIGCVYEDILGVDFFSPLTCKRQDIVEKMRELFIHEARLSFQIRDTVIHDSNKGSYAVDLVIDRMGDSARIAILTETVQDNMTVKMGKDFISNASHELRTPITIIRGFVETLRDLPEISDAMLEDILEKVLRSCKKMDDIVKNLLILADLDHLIKPNIQNIDIEALIDNCLYAIREIYPQADIQIQLPEKRLQVCVDAYLIELALMNLLHNAIKYSLPGTEILVQVMGSADSMMLSVIDRGCGIAEESRPYIFDRFYSANKAVSRKLGGAGLGLSIVKNVAEKHQGEVVCYPNPEGGTIFSLKLPQNLVVSS